AKVCKRRRPGRIERAALNTERSLKIVFAERRNADHCGGLQAGDFLHPLKQFLIEGRALGAFLVIRPAQRYIGDQYAVRFIAGINAAKVVECLYHQASADEQHKSNCNLRDYEYVAYALVAQTRVRIPAAFSERFGKLQLGCLKRWSQSENQARQYRNSERE